MNLGYLKYFNNVVKYQKENRNNFLLQRLDKTKPNIDEKELFHTEVLKHAQ